MKSNSQKRVCVLLAASALCLSLPLTGCSSPESGYVKEEIAQKTNAEQTACNGTAKGIYDAAASAITDMLTEDSYPISDLDGEYTLQGSDFSLASADSDNAKDSLKYKMAQYFTELKKIEQLKFRISGGSCVYVAVKDELGMYGTYPNALKDTDAETIDSISKAAAYAENGAA